MLDMFSHILPPDRKKSKIRGTGHRLLLSIWTSLRISVHMLHGCDPEFTLMKCAFGISWAVSPTHFTKSRTCSTCGVVSSESHMHLPGPIQNAFQTVTVRLPSWWILEIKLTPAIFTFKDGFWFCNELHKVTSTPGPPPDDWIASTISLEVSMLDPWLRWTLKCYLVALLSQGPLPYCRSENSRRLTKTPWRQLAKLAPTIKTPQY